MNRIVGLIFLVVIIVGVAGGIFFLQSKSNVPSNSPDSKNPIADHKITQQSDLLSSVLTLNPQNNSGETGMILMRESDKGLQVGIDIQSGFPKDTPQPAHIHKGSCAELGEVVYPLTNVTNGASMTTLQVSLSELKGQLPLAINVHKSESESTVYVACADVAGIL